MFKASLCAMAAGLCIASGALAQPITPELVPVRNPGNAADSEVMLEDGTTGYGSVGYEYRIGKFEITAGQYAAFLNAVAADDTYGLYSTDMWDSGFGCKIQRSGAPGAYTYAVDADWADRPVNFVSFGDAARFANWLHNGQPVGAQGAGTTEGGSYGLAGATDDSTLLNMSRNTGARFVIPTEDEWYKAAYYDGAGGVYYDYPTGTNATPDNALIDPDPGNNANFLGGSVFRTLGAPYYRSEVGDFENSASPCGTFDQAGNVKEWNESIVSIPGLNTYKGARGAMWNDASNALHANRRGSAAPTSEGSIGFRIVFIAPPFDQDGNEQVDIHDYIALRDCFLGPDGGISPDCGRLDFDGNFQVDMRDFAEFIRHFTN